MRASVVELTAKVPSATDRPAHQRLIVAGALVLVAAAAFATIVALASRSLLCDPTCTPDRRDFLRAQLVVAIVGLACTAATSVCAARRWQRAGVVCLVVAVFLYAAWGALLDRATHGTFFWS